jgi:hypothetical protein
MQFNQNAPGYADFIESLQEAGMIPKGPGMFPLPLEGGGHFDMSDEMLQDETLLKKLSESRSRQKESIDSKKHRAPSGDEGEMTNK